MAVETRSGETSTPGRASQYTSVFSTYKREGYVRRYFQIEQPSH